MDAGQSTQDAIEIIAVCRWFGVSSALLTASRSAGPDPELTSRSVNPDPVICSTPFGVDMYVFTSLRVEPRGYFCYIILGYFFEDISFFVL